MIAILKTLAALVLLLVVLLGLAVTIVPRFLDRIYYRGPASAHFDGERFFNPDGENERFGPPAGGSRLGFLWNQMTGRDGRPVWPDHVPVTPVAPPARVEGGQMVATWVGHATVLVQTHGLNILTDPVWSDKVGPFGLVGPTRVAAPGIDFDKLPRIDLILVSHNHYDHLDLATLKRLWQRDRPAIVTSLGNDSVIGQVGAQATALDWGDWAALTPTGVVRRDKPCDPTPWCIGDRAQIMVARNHHWGSRWGTDRNRALWSAFVVQLPDGGNLFFAGDTGMGDGRWIDEAARFGPYRLALLPIGAFRFVPGQMAIGSHMGPVDAVEVYRRLGASRAIPIHWGTFRLSFEGYHTPPKLLAHAMACTRQTGFLPVEIGHPTEIAPYAPAIHVPELSRDQLLRCLDTPEVHALR